MRNSHQSMNAPTGNTGIYARNVSGGIEPVFSYGYSRWVIVPEFDRRALIAEGFKFPDVGQGEWFETDTLKFTNRETSRFYLAHLMDVIMKLIRVVD